VIGSARATAAITIVNALPTGIGCALGIGIPVRARITLHPSPSSREPVLRYSRGANTPVVREALRLALDRYGPNGAWSADVELRSQIPPGRGLKSSSAVATAVALAAARATGEDPGDEEIARLAAGAGRTSGISATGAMDDALASLRPGFCVTDNRADRVIRSVPPDPNWRVALLIPREHHARSPEWKAAFEREAAAGRRAADAALRGEWWTAMAANTELVERTMGYHYQELREELARRGALASGVSGLGPALAAITEERHESDVLGALPRSLGASRSVPITLPGGGSE
jgi:shikimate kinase